MKTLLLSLFAAAFLFNTSFSQIPNNDFENWYEGSPVDWASPNVSGIMMPITQITSVHGGASALRGDVIQFYTQLIPPVIQSGADAQGFPIDQRYQSITGWYQFNPVGGDRFYVNTGLFVNDNPIALAAQEFPALVNTYTQFTVNFQYTSPEVPNRCIIQIGIVGPTTGTDLHLGSYYFLDDLAFSGLTGVNSEGILNEFTLGQNYPNPFNPSTKISYSVAQLSNVSLKVYDALGTEVAELINEEKPAGKYEIDFDASKLSSGIYLYTLRAGSFVETKKMMILK